MSVTRATLFFVLMLMIKSIACAQSCTQDDLLNKTGSWKKYNDLLQPGKNYSPEMKPEIFNRLEKIRQIIANAYTPKGMEVGFEKQIYGIPPAKNNTVTYALWGQLLEYGCDAITHHLVLAAESSDHFFALINHFGQFVFFDSSIRIGNFYIALMSNRVGNVKGSDLFQTSLVRNNERFIIVSRQGQLPYIPLTQQQYLTALKEKFQRAESNNIARDAKFAKDENQRLKNEEYWKSYYTPKIKAIDEYLSRSTEIDLGQTAFVKDLQDFKRFYPEKEGGRMPVIINASYFTPGLRPYFPQFIMVAWQWNDGEGPGGGILRPVPPDMNICCKVAKYFKESMEQHLDPGAFRDMLDK
jgi:hypothetical protein